MRLDERITYFLLGAAIGLVIGYLVRLLRETRADVHDIGDRVTEIQNRTKDERGVMQKPNARSIALFIVVAVTLYAAVLSQHASNKSNDTSERIISLQSTQKQNLDCTTQVLFDAIRALNERTTYSGAQAAANVDLVQAQFDWLTKAQDPSLSQADQQKLFQTYVTKVQTFLSVAAQNASQLQLNPYPTVDDLTACLTGTDKPNKE